MSELKAAAERIVSTEAVYFDDGSDYDCDTHEVARAVLSYHDDTPIDEAFLRECGFELLYPSAFAKGDLKATDYGDSWTLWKNSGGRTWFKVRTGLTTRGQLRRLLSVLEGE